jgi:hypothetical protein
MSIASPAMETFEGDQVSPDLSEEAAAPAAEPQDANSEPSSSSDDADANQSPASLLDVVEDVLKKEEPEPEGSSSPEAKQDQEPEPEAKAEGEDADVPFHKHPRWAERTKELQALRPQAEAYQAITGFMERSSLSGEEVAEGFEIMALLKSGDPANLVKARDWFQERLVALNSSIGDTLPADLQQQVEDGLVDLEVAQNLSRTRAEAQYLRAQEQDRTKREHEERELTRAQENTQAMRSVVVSWETQVKAKDPDYAKKAKLVETTAEAMVARKGKPPATAQEALDLVEAAYREVNEVLKPMQPRPQPMTASPAGASARVVAAPKTLREAIDGALTR